MNLVGLWQERNYIIFIFPIWFFWSNREKTLKDNAYVDFIIKAKATWKKNKPFRIPKKSHMKLTHMQQKLKRGEVIHLTTPTWWVKDGMRTEQLLCSTFGWLHPGNTTKSLQECVFSLDRTKRLMDMGLIIN